MHIAFLKKINESNLFFVKAEGVYFLVVERYGLNLANARLLNRNRVVTLGNNIRKTHWLAVNGYL